MVITIIPFRSNTILWRKTDLADAMLRTKIYRKESSDISKQFAQYMLPAPYGPYRKRLLSADNTKCLRSFTTSTCAPIYESFDSVSPQPSIENIVSSLFGQSYFVLLFYSSIYHSKIVNNIEPEGEKICLK